MVDGRPKGAEGQRCCFAYVIAASGRVLHTLLDPQGGAAAAATHSASFNHNKQPPRHTGLQHTHPKTNRHMWSAYVHIGIARGVN